MEPTLLITDGGPHPADKWATVTAKHISNLVQVDENSASAEAVAARLAKPQFEANLAVALAEHHMAVQTRARGTPDHPRFAHSDDVNAAMRAVQAEAGKTPFGYWYAADHVKEAVRGILNDHFAGSIAIEREYALKKGA